MRVIRRFFINLVARIGTAFALVGYFWKRKIWWMVPLVSVLLVLAVLVVFAQSSAISAFIYTLF